MSDADDRALATRIHDEMFHGHYPESAEEDFKFALAVLAAARERDREDREALKADMRAALAGMDKHDNAEFACESTIGADGAGECRDAIESALARLDAARSKR